MSIGISFGEDRPFDEDMGYQTLIQNAERTGRLEVLAVLKEIIANWDDWKVLSTDEQKSNLEAIIRVYDSGIYGFVSKLNFNK